MTDADPVIRRVRRTVDFRYRLICFYCTTGEIIYESMFSNFHSEQIRDEGEWEQSLTRWGDMMRTGIEEFLERAARNKCRRYGRAGTICWRYEIEEPGITFGEETILVHVPEVVVVPVVPVVPIVPSEIVNTIKGYEKAAKSLRESAERLKAIPSLKEDFEKRATELEEKAKDLRERYGLVGKEL